MPVLEICDDATSDFLVNANGDPVWPVRDAADREALQGITSLYSSEVISVPCAPQRNNAGWGEVVSLGNEFAYESEFYAHLTRRRHHVVTSPEDLLLRRRVEVVILSLEQLTSRLLEALYAPGARSPGIILSDGRHALRRQLLVRSAAAELSKASPLIPSITLLPTQSMTLGWESSSRVLDARSSVKDIKSALATNASILTMITHGDGLDMYLGPLTLCTLHGSDVSRAGDRPPVCVVSGECHRLEQPIVTALASGKLLSPSDIAARIFFCASCCGILTSESTVDPGWGLALRCLNSFQVGAVVTSWTLHFAHPSAQKSLQFDLEGGTPVGKAVARYNRRSEAENLGARFCVLGDPRTTAGRKRQKFYHSSRSPYAITASATGAPDDEKTVDEFSFFRAYLTQILWSSRFAADSMGEGIIHEAHPYAESALAALDRYKAAKSGGKNPDACISLARSLRERLLRTVFRRGAISGDWFLYVSHFLSGWAPRICWACASSAREATFALGIEGGAPRRLLICPRCGFVEDVANDVDARFELDPSKRLVTLSGCLPKTDWSAVLQFNSPHQAFSRLWKWPAKQDGSPRRRWQTPKAWPRGPQKVSFNIVHAGSINCVTRTIHMGYPAGKRAP